MLMSITGLFASQDADSLDAIKRDAPKIYLDCRCDEDFIRTNITYVNYVIERQEAQVHILQTRQETASNGDQYTLYFIGHNNFDGRNDTLVYNTHVNDTDDIKRDKMVRYLQIGLMPYVAKTPAVGFLNVSFDKVLKPTAVDDKWDSWVFDISTSGHFSGEEQQKSSSTRGRISADRITPDLKIRIDLGGSYSRTDYDFEDEPPEQVNKWNSSFQSFTVKSISEHWSVGFRVRGASSSYENIKQEILFMPAIEYNFFPYSEFNRRELRFDYSIGYENIQYIDSTIFDKTKEILLEQHFSIDFEMKEPWGEIDLELSADNYLHDKDLYRISIDGELELKLFKYSPKMVTCCCKFTNIV